jgi:hypothetical protein
MHRTIKEENKKMIRLGVKPSTWSEQAIKDFKALIFKFTWMTLHRVLLNKYRKNTIKVQDEVESISTSVVDHIFEYCFKDLHREMMGGFDEFSLWIQNKINNKLY